ncbi:hypothetical protein GCM10028787_32940 [Brachybacterium horti]|uniref:Antitoxin HicB n=1 Tax=Brachybacterium rhamnosum TaxID=173361 RepID=A0ABW4Q0I7_9MICO
MSTKVYEAVVTKDSAEWWMIEVPEVGVFGQVASLAKAPVVARELIGMWLDVDPSDVEVTITAQPDEATVATLSKAERLGEEAAALTHEAARLRAEAVRNYVTEYKVTRREAAEVLGISYQRVQQLVSS